MRSQSVVRKVPVTGFRYVVEARVLNMIKWTRIIIFVAIANPILYLLSIGIGVGSLIDSNNRLDGVSYLTFLANKSSPDSVYNNNLSGNSSSRYAND